MSTLTPLQEEQMNMPEQTKKKSQRTSSYSVKYYVYFSTTVQGPPEVKTRDKTEIVSRKIEKGKVRIRSVRLNYQLSRGGRKQDAKDLCQLSISGGEQYIQ